MKRHIILILCLTGALLLLCSCSAKPPEEEFPDITQALGPTDTPAPIIPSSQAPDTELFEDYDGSQSIFDVNPYLDYDGFTEEDALAEEVQEDPNEAALLAYEAGRATAYVYAGSTPIPLDPIDMPTPTPRPELSFNYVAYSAPMLGVSFEAPEGWESDTSESQLYILREPFYDMKDGQLCEIIISAEPISSSYSAKELKSHVTQRLDSLYTADIEVWKPSLTATRYMMGANGVYANYTATRYDGTKIGGRIHYVCSGKTLYGVEIVYPLGYKDDFLNVFGKIRSTLAKVN